MRSHPVSSRLAECSSGLRRAPVLFVGNDWAEDHHDVEIVDIDGRRLGKKRFPEGVAGLAGLHALIADHLPDDADPADVVIGIETDRGPWVQALIAAGYTVYVVNPLQAARYRERHGTSGSKSDPGDAHVLAEVVRLDRAHHRPVAGDSDTAEHVKVMARAHQSMIWSRQRQANMLRSMLREFYPAAFVAFGDDLTGRDALAVLAVAPSPELGRRLTTARVVTVLRKAGRKRNAQAAAEKIVAAHRAARGPARGGRCLRGQRRGSGRGVGSVVPAGRRAGRAGG
jgi:transposase